MPITSLPMRPLGRDGQVTDVDAEVLPTDDELKPKQVAAMQSLDDARRAGEITDADFREIEVVIRRGHVHGARKRITEAKRRHAAR